MSEITRRGALFGSVVAALTCWLPGRGKAKDQLSEPAPTHFRHDGKPKLEVPAIFMFPFPIPAPEEWVGATSAEQEGLTFDMACWIMAEITAIGYEHDRHCDLQVERTLAAFPHPGLRDSFRRHFDLLRQRHPRLALRRIDVSQTNFMQDGRDRYSFRLEMSQYIYRATAGAIGSFPVARVIGWTLTEPRKYVYISFYGGFWSEQLRLQAQIREMFPENHPQLVEASLVVSRRLWDRARNRYEWEACWRSHIPDCRVTTHQAI